MQWENCSFYVQKVILKKEMLGLIAIVANSLWYFSDSFNSEFKRYLCCFLTECLATFPRCVISMKMVIKHNIVVSYCSKSILQS